MEIDCYFCNVCHCDFRLLSELLLVGRRMSLERSFAEARQLTESSHRPFDMSFLELFRWSDWWKMGSECKRRKRAELHWCGGCGDFVASLWDIEGTEIAADLGRSLQWTVSVVSGSDRDPWVV